MASFSNNAGAPFDQSDQRQQQRGESEQPYVVRLTPTVHAKLVQYLNQPENTGLRQSDVIGGLLTAGDSGGGGGGGSSSATTQSSTAAQQHHQQQQRSPPTFTSPMMTRRRGLVTVTPTTVMIQQQPLTTPPVVVKRVVTTRIVDNVVDEEDEHNITGVDDYDHEEEIDNMDEDDEELNYGDEYVYEEEVVEHESPPPALSPQHAANAAAYYYTTPSRAPRGRRRGSMPAAETRVTRQASSRQSMPAPKRKQCHPDRKAVGTGKQKPWTSNLRRYIYDLISKFQRDYLLHCRECDRWMKVAHSQSGLRCGNVLDHVCAHLGKPMFACRLCPQQTVTSIQMRKHLSKVHNRTNDFDDLTDNFYGELVERIARCFDYSDAGGPPENKSRRLLTCKRKRGEVGIGHSFQGQPIDPETASVRRHLHELINKWQRQNAIYCRNCNRWIRTGSESAWAQAQAALAHVCGHYNKEVFACLVCDEHTVTYYQMIRHIRHVHQTISRGNCVDQVDEPEHAPELKEIASKCFDWDEGSGPPDLTAESPFLKKRRGERQRNSQQDQSMDEELNLSADGDSNPTGSCRLEALEFIRRMIRESIGDTNSMTCAECDLTTAVRSRRGIRAELLLDHVFKHLDKDAYACPKCDKTTKRKDAMRTHMLSHKGVKSTDYIDNTGQIREEIFEKLKQCYLSTNDKEKKDDGEEGTSGGVEEMAEGQV